MIERDSLVITTYGKGKVLSSFPFHIAQDYWWKVQYEDGTIRDELELDIKLVINE